jgi:hypothetical protein
MSKYPNYEIHPLANSMPMMNDKEFEALKENIELHGLLNPIIIDHKDRIIDGRNRYKACIETDTEPRFITLTNFLKDYQTYLGEHFYDLENQSGNLNKALEAGDDEKVIEMLITILNVNRRHLSDFESYLSLKQNKELVKQGEIGKNHEKVRVAESATLKTEEKEKVTLDEAAKELNVSKKKLQRMKYIDQHGSDELKEEVKQGKKSVDKGYNELRAQAKAKQEPKEELNGEVNVAKSAMNSQNKHHARSKVLDKIEVRKLSSALWGINSRIGKITKDNGFPLKMLSPLEKDILKSQSKFDQLLSKINGDENLAEARNQSKPKLKFTNYCASLYNKSMSMARDIDLLTELKEEFIYLNFKDIKDTRIKAQLLSELKNLNGRISSLLQTIQDEHNGN